MEMRGNGKDIETKSRHGNAPERSSGFFWDEQKAAATVSTGPEAPNPPREVTVNLIIDRPTNDGFRLESSEVPTENGRLTFRNDRHDGFIVNFKIDDTQGVGAQYVFPNDKDKALWARKVTSTGGCPDEDCSWGQFKADKVLADPAGRNKTLVVRNKNGHLQYFGFALRVGTDPDEEPSLTFDPIGDNQNGQSS